MEKMFSEKFHLRTSDFDTNGHIKPSAVLDLFQEVAGAHAKSLGIGFLDLAKNGLLWVLVKVKYKIVGEISMHQSVMVKTWPLKPAKIILGREYTIEDMSGNVLCIGTSEWVLMNAATRKFATTDNLYPLDDFCEDKNFEDKIRKIPDFDAQDALSYTITPTFCDFDINGHVNNIKYADYVINLIKPAKNQKIQQLQLDFHREIKGNTSVNIYAQSLENEIVAKGIDEGGEKMFCCKINLA